jgi:DNA-binding response OmpR family regulator
MNKEKITVLLVEDEARLLTVLQQTLELYGYHVVTAADGIEGYKNFRRYRPAIAVIDIMLPLLDGYSLLQKIRRHDTAMPVIFLTAKSQTADLVKGFEYGVSDYIKKPFVIDELLARIKSLIARTKKKENAATEEIYRFGNFEFKYNIQELCWPAGQVQLSYKDAEILRRLAANMHNVVESVPLLLELWGDDNLYTARTLNVYITRIRHYLKPDPRVQIINIRSVGFKLIEKL